MRAWLPLVAGLLLVGGCQDPAPTVPPVEKTSPEASKPEPRPTSSTTDPEPAPATKIPEGDNESRIHQLRELKKGTVKVNGRSVPVWVMDDDAKRAEGMMFLREKEVKPTEGMLFVFPNVQEAGRGFWMQNTFLPLDIIYIASDGRVVHTVKGKPFDETPLPSPAAYQFVLEMRQGAAQKMGVKPGSRIEVPKNLQSGVS